MANGGKRMLPDIPRSWFILAALIAAGAALLLRAITQAEFMTVLGVVFGIHTVSSEQRAKKTQEIAAAGTGAATVAAIKADPDVVTVAQAAPGIGSVAAVGEEAAP